MFSLYLKNRISDLTEKVVSLDRIIAQKCNRYILAYHRILPDEAAQGEYVQSCMWTAAKTFEEQIKWMLKRGEIVDIEKILDFSGENTRPLFSITFDDGWKDNYDHAFPILKRYGTTATVFVVTSAVKTGRLLWPDEAVKKTDSALKNGKKREILFFIKDSLALSARRLFRGNIYEIFDHYVEYLKELDLAERERQLRAYYAHIGADLEPIEGFMLNWNEISEMDAYGIRFGSHTHTHIILKNSTERAILDELTLSKTILEERLKKPVDIFSYPNARYNNNDAELLRRTGYKYGFRLHNLPLRKSHSRYFIPRVLLYEKTCSNQNCLKLKLLGVPRF